MDILHQEGEGYGIHAALGDDDVGVALGGLYEVAVGQTPESRRLPKLPSRLGKGSAGDPARPR